MNNQFNQDVSNASQTHNHQNDPHKSNTEQMVVVGLNDLRKEIQKLTQIVTENQAPPKKEYYSVKEVAKIIDRTEFTVREYCRLKRINAEKCESGRGRSCEWKISFEELTYYKNNGLRFR